MVQGYVSDISRVVAFLEVSVNFHISVRNSEQILSLVSWRAICATRAAFSLKDIQLFSSTKGKRGDKRKTENFR